MAATIRVCRVVNEIESTVDIPYVSYDVTIWTSVKINTGLFCTSAPSLKPLLQKSAPGILSSSSRPTKNRSNFGNYASGTRTGKRTVTNQAFELNSQINLGYIPGGKEYSEGDSFFFQFYVIKCPRNVIPKHQKFKDSNPYFLAIERRNQC